jgi:hypothetical protein
MRHDDSGRDDAVELHSDGHSDQADARTAQVLTAHDAS